MILKDITNTAAVLLGWDSPYEDNADFSTLQRCANLVISEVACEYAPPKYTQTITHKNGIVTLGSLHKDMLEFICATDAFGNELPVKVYSDYLKVPVDTEKITYTFIPERLTALEQVPVGDRRITDRVFAYGAVAEYCLITGRFDEAVKFNNKYIAALKNAIFKKAGRVAERSWA